MTDITVKNGQLSDEQLISQLRQAQTIAVVGLSPKPERASHRVAAYMQQVGYRIIPIRPGMETILGEPCFASLDDIPKEITVDIVDVFRRAEDTPAIAETASHILTRNDSTSRLFWLQSGIINDTTMEIARKGGLLAVQDLCLMVEHQRLAQFIT